MSVRPATPTVILMPAASGVLVLVFLLGADILSSHSAPPKIRSATNRQSGRVEKVEPQTSSGLKGKPNFLPFAEQVLKEWEAGTSTFLNPDMPSWIAGQISWFSEIACYPGNNLDTIAKCKSILTDKNRLSVIVKRYLTQTFLEPKSVRTNLASLIPSAIGLDFTRAGYPVTSQSPRPTSCAHLPDAYSKDSALFFDGDERFELPPGVKLCLRTGSYYVSVPHKDVQLRLDFLHADNGLPTSNAFVISRSNVLPKVGRIAPPSNLQCLGVPGLQSPATDPLSRRDDIYIAAPRNFSTVTSVRLFIEDQGKLCDETCQGSLFVGLVEVISLWKHGCTRCSLANLITISGGGTSYFNVDAVNRLNGYLKAKHPFPNGSDRLLEADAFRLPEYQILDSASPEIAPLCAASLPSSFSSLCKGAAAGNSMDLKLRISNAPDTCLTAKAIACASPEGLIELRAIDHVFVISEGESRIRFGSGGSEFDIITVLIHEMGHFFGLPHIQGNTAQNRTKSDAMVRFYNSTGFCITNSDYNMLNRAVDPQWPYRLTECAGLYE